MWLSRGRARSADHQLSMRKLGGGKLGGGGGGVLGEGVHALINHFDGLRPCRPGEKPATSKHQRRSPEKPKPENIHNNFRYLSLPVARHEMAAFRGVQQQNPPECSLICRGWGR